jgi:phosphate acyltransferase
MRIAVDAMGGDHAPHNVVAGVCDILRQTGGRFSVQLVGPAGVIKAELAKTGGAGLPVEIVDAPEIIGMHDEAVAGIKQKKNSSISVGVTMHRDGGTDAFVSAGHSGAVMSAATLILGRIRGVSRPTIGTFLPSENGVTLVLDAGANVDCKPQYLFEFARMGSIYTSRMLNRTNPTVGLLSIGEESSKGNELVKEAHKLLKESDLNFIGNVEGNDILRGKADVIVCDGFVGNVILKFAEGVPGFLKHRARQYADAGIMAKLKAMLARPVFRGMLSNLNYEEYGGVPVLGVNGVVMIGHGKSSPRAISNMVLRAEEMVRQNILSHLQQALK